MADVCAWYRVAEKEEAAEEGKKKKGGIQIPEEWPWEAAKELFNKPDVTPADELDLDWKSPDVEGLVDFLVKEKGFKCVLASVSNALRSDRSPRQRGACKKRS